MCTQCCCRIINGLNRGHCWLNSISVSEHAITVETRFLYYMQENHNLFIWGLKKINTKTIKHLLTQTSVSNERKTLNHPNWKPLFKSTIWYICSYYLQYPFQCQIKWKLFYILWISFHILGKNPPLFPQFPV